MSSSGRHFLGAAAAVWDLGRDEEMALYDEVETPESQQDAPARPREQTHSGLGGSIVADTFGTADLGVATYRKQTKNPVAMEVGLGGFSAAVEMEPSEARDVAQSLLDAADSVEEWREYAWSDEMRDKYGVDQ